MKQFSNLAKITLVISGVLMNLQTSLATLAWGPCDLSVSYMPNFDASQYVGKWYEIKRDQDITFQEGFECTVPTYGALNNNQVSVHNYAYDFSKKEKQTIDGIATCKGSICKVKFNNFFIPVGNYNVLDTDYTNYAIVHSCRNQFFGLFRSEVMWILSRT